MLKQYFQIKAEHPGVILAMRVGDFYEFYGEDAETAATALEITLTGRDDGGERVAMAGVPFHSVEKYLARLVSQGFKVAICDQLEDPKAAKGLVKRGVTRVLTPGTVLEDAMLQSGQNNFLAAICSIEGRLGLAFLDPSTGDFAVTELSGDEMEDRLLSELARLRPSELLVDSASEGYGELARANLGSAVTGLNPANPDRSARRLMERFDVRNLEGFGCADKPGALVAAAMILAYAEKNGLSLEHIEGFQTYSVDGFMRLDPSTRRSLELTESLSDRSRRHTLLSVLDCMKTPMGSRMLRRWIEQPLLERAAIDLRLDAVGRLKDSPMARGDLRDEFEKMADIERLVSRCATGIAGPRDLGALRSSLVRIPKLGVPLAKVGFGLIAELQKQIADLAPLRLQLEKALVAELPHTVREGGIIRPGYDLELDKLKELSRNGKSFIAALELAERERTGIGTLKVGFNSVFGYYIEVGKAHLAKVPEDYIRKQTTAGAERYITAELKDHESQVLGAEEKCGRLEAELFAALRRHVATHAQPLLATARAIAELDVLSGLAETAQKRDYARPVLTDDDRIEIVSGRHPIVEAAHLGFVPNDLEFGATNEAGARIMVLTGPNMSGKSTYLRQNALIVLMAQIGCFVPAKRAEIGICDRVFARIGAKDEIALGQSTFMVEMVESANILNHATSRSLVVLDEVGRGTSTYDGMAIAWAMIEHLAEIGCRTMFATHYHLLNSLEGQMPTVANYRVAVEEVGSDIIWTHRVLPGGADRSYGVHVARMAGVPPAVLSRAREILKELEGQGDPVFAPAQTAKLQLTLFEAERPEVVEELGRLEVEKLTPVQALLLLDEWKRKWGGGE
jgi:DNA mismatch repair protein MutS